MDATPNYLNLHNIDPARVEAAPMRNARPCGLMLNAECGMQNDGQDAGAERLEKLPGNDSIRPWKSEVVKMTREEAANILDLRTRPEALADFVGPELAGIVHQAMVMGAEALRSPWVKTSDRLPTEADADNTMCWVFATTKNSDLPMPEAIAYIRANPDNYPYWMPVPPLPGKECEPPAMARRDYPQKPTSGLIEEDA